MEDLLPVKIHGKVVQVPRELVERNEKMGARAFAVETGQATWEEMNGAPTPEGYKPSVGGNFDAAMIGAGRSIASIRSNIQQAGNEMIGNTAGAERNKAEQAEIQRLAAPIKESNPISGFLGEMLPYFAVPGGRAAQMAAGVTAGALEGDTAAGRAGGAALGAAGAHFGQKLGDKAGAAIQNRIQQRLGNPYAPARKTLMDSGVPLNLSERTDGALSKPMARFFERAKFVMTNKQPNGENQQKALTRLVTDALGTESNVLNREALGKVVDSNKEVFRNAANRAADAVDRANGTHTGKIPLSQRRAFDADRIIADFDDVGSDSNQVVRVFREFEDFATNPEGLDANKLLRLRSRLSASTVKNNVDLETDALVDAINLIDDQLAEYAPDLAADLVQARDRFRLLLAIRRGAALKPNGEININTLTKNLERVFRDFDAGKPLPRSLSEAGEALAGFNEVSNGFRSSGTAENALAAGAPAAIAAGAQNPGILMRALAGGVLPFAGGGTGALLGGGAGRSAGFSIQDKLIQDQLFGTPPSR